MKTRQQDLLSMPRESARKENERSKTARRYQHPSNSLEWIEYYWLLLSDPVFRAAPDKRKAYFEYRLGKQYDTSFN